MIKYVCLVKLRLESFTTWKLEYISRGLNERADALVVVVASLIIKETVFPSIYYRLALSIAINQVNEIDGAWSSRMTPIVHYLISRELLDNKIATHNI